MSPADLTLASIFHRAPRFGCRFTWIEADPAVQLEVENGPPTLYRVAVYCTVGVPGAGCARTG